MEYINISTFNCWGFNNLIIQQTINEYLEKSRILCLQETWKYNINEFANLNKTFQIVHSCSMDENLKLVGRPFGGLAIILTKDISFKLVAQQKHFIIIEALINGRTIVICNTYLPPKNPMKTENKNFQFI